MTSNTIQISAADISAQFAHPQETLPRLSTATSRPTFTSIYDFQDKLIENATSIPLNDTDLGHLALVISDNAFTMANGGTAHVPPTNPGLNPVHQTTATAPQIMENNRIHAENTRNYKTYQTTKILLRNMIINSVDDIYINALKHRVTKYSTVAPIDLLTHLKTTYGTITIDDLTANTKRMTTAWNPPTPIEELWATLKDGQEFAKEGGETIADTQLIRLAYENINNTGLFASALKKWRQKPAAEQTYTNFKTHFTTEVEDYERHQPTAGSQGYANNTEQIQNVVHQELHNILTHHNPELFQKPHEEPNINPSPTVQSPSPQESANSTAVITELRNIIAALEKSNLSNNDNQHKRGHRPISSPKRREPLTAQGLDSNNIPITYCWSHGITSNLRHTSRTCKRKKQGHKDNATLNDKMGGNTCRYVPPTST
jgi:hypothetical protein